MSDQAWLTARKSGIGASEIAAVFGLSPHQSKYQLWADKSGLADHVVEETEAMAWGKRLESAIAEAYAERTGHEVTLNGQRIAWAKGVPWLFATPDAFIEAQDKPGQGVLELKAASAYAEGWDDEVPPLHYRLQVQHQMIATGCRWGAVACFDGSSLSLKVWECVWSSELAQAILTEGAAFWNLVERTKDVLMGGATSGKLTDLEMSLGPAARDLPTISKVHRGAGQSVSDLSEHREHLLQWAGLSAKSKRLQEQADDAKAAALVLAGDAGIILDDGRIVAKKDKRGAWRLQDDYRERALAMVGNHTAQEI